MQGSVFVAHVNIIIDKEAKKRGGTRLCLIKMRVLVEIFLPHIA